MALTLQPLFCAASARLLLVLACALASCQSTQPQAFSDLPDEAGQFDFWTGGWDVNLRVQQADFSWLDSLQAHAQVYPILYGKAVLELWDSPTTKGYSLRYFDQSLGKWVLWLNWPSQDSSGSSSLRGEFRHGRGEFFSRSTRADGGVSVSRFSFSDITPNSLRWDDAYSQDGGATWTNQWIMEFSRNAQTVNLPLEGGPAHTYIDGSRGSLPQFRTYEFLSGTWVGETQPRHADEQRAVQLRAWNILDGCAVIGLINLGTDHEAFFHLTWNTYASRYEITYLDSTAGSSAIVAYSPANATELVFPLSPDDEPSPEQIEFRQNDEGHLEVHVQFPNNTDRAWPADSYATLSRSR